MCATLHNGKLHVGGIFELSKVVIASFDINSIDFNGNRCYALVIEFNIPDEVRNKIDDLPLSINQEEAIIDHVSNFTKHLIQMTCSNIN